MKNVKMLSNETLITLAGGELIQAIKDFRDEKRKDFEDIGPANAELFDRGMKLGITKNLIHKVFTGEFDNADALEVKLTKNS